MKPLTVHCLSVYLLACLYPLISPAAAEPVAASATTAPKPSATTPTAVALPSAYPKKESQDKAERSPSEHSYLLQGATLQAAL